MIGLDLHDDLGQRLTGIAMLASAAQRRLKTAAPREAPRVGELATKIQLAWNRDGA